MGRCKQILFGDLCKRLWLLNVCFGREWLDKSDGTGAGQDGGVDKDYDRLLSEATVLFIVNIGRLSFLWIWFLIRYLFIF